MSLKTKVIAGLMAFGITATTFAQERFTVYGFIDATYSQRFNVKDNSPLLMRDILNPKPTFATGNVNLYFDFNPTENTRALIETNLLAFQTDSARLNKQDPTLVFGALPTGALDSYALDGPTITSLGLPLPSGTTIGEIRAALPSLGFTAEQADATADEIAAGVYAGMQAGLQQGANLLNPTQAGRVESFHKTIELERAWFEYSHSDLINFRVGRFITPAGIWNVDHGSPIITTVAQPNQTSFFPIFPERQQGVMLNGTMFVGDHDLAYSGYVSTGRFQDGVGDAIETRQDLELDQYAVGGNLKFRMDILDGVSFGASGMKGTVNKNEPKVSFRSMSAADAIAIASGTQVFDLSDAMTTYNAITNLDELVGGVDMKLESDGFTFQGEYNYRFVTNNRKTVFNGATVASPGDYTEYTAFYGLISYRIPLTPMLAVTPYSLFEQIKWSNVENTNLTIGLFPMDGWNTYMLGLNWSLGSNFIIKTEFQYGELLTRNPKDSNPALIDWTMEQGDLDVATFSTQFSMAF